MPAKSKSQQRLMAWVHAYKNGKAKDAPKKIREVSRHISDNNARDFAKTKHNGLPEKKADDYRPSWFTGELEDLINAFTEDRDYDINISTGPILKYDKGKPISYKFPAQSNWFDFTNTGRWWKHYLRGRNLQSTPPPRPNRESSLQLIKKRNSIA